MSPSMLAISGAILLATAACAGVRVHEPVDGQNYYDGVFEYATRNGVIRTEVVGNPFAENFSELVDTVSRNMTGATWGREVRFLTGPSDGFVQDFKVVTVFNNTRPIRTERLCLEASRQQTGTSSGTTTFQTVFCQGGHLITEASGAVDGARNSRDPKFRQLVREVTRALIPAVDKNAISNDGGVVP